MSGEKMCSCGHTFKSHFPGECVGCTGPDCDGVVWPVLDFAARNGSPVRTARDLLQEIAATIGDIQLDGSSEYDDDTFADFAARCLSVAEFLGPAIATEDET